MATFFIELCKTVPSVDVLLGYKFRELERLSGVIINIALS